MVRNKIPEAIQAQVRRRANFLCEYCHASELWQYVRFTVDHVIPLTQGGEEGIGNLALACFHCNRRKSNHVIGFDAQSGIDVPLFQPRRDRWNDHFSWSADSCLILGLTPTGRATIAILDLNRDRVIPIRAADRQIGRHPPTGDRTPMDLQ